MWEDAGLNNANTNYTGFLRKLVSWGAVWHGNDSLLKNIRLVYARYRVKYTIYNHGRYLGFAKET